MAAKTEKGLKQEIVNLFPVRLRQILEALPLDFARLEEIRLRCGQPILFRIAGKEMGITGSGDLTELGSSGKLENWEKLEKIREKELKDTLEIMGGFSLYAAEEELRQGFFTVRGGHRIGVAGRVILKDRQITGLKAASFLNVRVAHEIKGCADQVLPFLYVNGKFVSTLIVSPPGCGKTTLARCIMRVYQPDTGEIDFAGTDIAKFNDKQMYPYRKKMAMIFQDPFSSLDPRQTAESIVGESLLIHKLVKTREEYEQRVDELLRMVDLDPSMKNRVPHEFSGGQRQRIGIARALSSNPDLIICDEPISALDVSIQAQIINLLEELQAKLGLTYLFIAHDLAVVKHISDRILVMYLGRIVEIAECEELYNNTLHPYTKVLLGAVPVADPKVEKTRERVEIRGEVPSLTNRPAGCPFSDRCRYATERCKKEVPTLKDIGNGHEVACFLYE